MITLPFVIAGAVMVIFLFGSVVHLARSWARSDEEEEAERRLRDYGTLD